MSKPDWKDAPEWAQWVARDYYGEWWWYERKPKIGFEVWMEPTGGQKGPTEECAPDWTESLEPRP